MGLRLLCHSHHYCGASYKNANADIPAVDHNGIIIGQLVWSWESVRGFDCRETEDRYFVNLRRVVILTVLS